MGRVQGTKSWRFVMRGDVPPEYTEEQIIALVVSNVNVGLPILGLVRESDCKVTDDASSLHGLKLDS